jgi:hypothetical protein
VDSEDPPKAQEKKTNYLIPKGSGRLDEGGYNMPDELPPYTECLALPHVSIVTKAASPAIQVCPTAVELPIENL